MAKKTAQWIKTDATATFVTPANGTDFSLKEMQSFVGGYVELINLPDGREMYVNEDGKMKLLPINRDATVLWQGSAKSALMTDWIRGDVLVTDRGMVK